MTTSQPSAWIGTSLLLIRHAQSENNAKPEPERVSDPAITTLGIKQSDLLAEAMAVHRPTMIYCSPFLRSLQTTLPVSRSAQLTPEIRSDLFEQGGCFRGYAEIGRQAERGLSRDAIRKLHPDWALDSRIGVDGWNLLNSYESIDQARSRALQVRNWLEGNPDKHAQQRIALVIHADFILRMLEAFLGMQDAESFLKAPANTSVTVLECCLAGELSHENKSQASTSGGSVVWKMLTYNQFSHLSDNMFSD